MRNKAVWLDKPIKLENIIAFLLGLGICERISIALHIGSTDFSFLEVFSPILFVFFIITRSSDVKSLIKNIPLGFKLFFGIVLFSVIPGLIYFRDVGIIYRYAMGLISFFIYFSTAANVFVLKDKKNFIIKGIVAGLIVNLVFSIVCFISYRFGNVFTLSKIPLFAREYFYVPIYSFRSQGLFLEPSHFIRFFASVILIVIATLKTKNPIIKPILIFLSLIAVALSFSGSLAILAAGVMIYIILKKKQRKIEPSSLVLIFLLLSVTVVFFATNLSKNLSITGFIDSILTGADITSDENSGRLGSMLTFVGYLDSIFLGCGWNLTGTLIEVENLPTVAAFSEVLQITVEVGIVGGAIYLISTVCLIFSLLKNRSDYSIALAVSLMMILALQIGTDYSIDSCNMLVFGLAIAELSERPKKARTRALFRKQKREERDTLQTPTSNQIGEQENADS